MESAKASDLDMADNYLEKKYEEYLNRKAAAEKARKIAWKKRMDAYRRKLQQQQEDTSVNDNNRQA